MITDKGPKSKMTAEKWPKLPNKLLLTYHALKIQNV